MASRFYDFGVRRIDGTETSLSEFAGSAVLVVNVASQCGLTPQYEGLERIYRSYRERGFAVLGFPSNEFAGQEPGTDAEIHDFCRSTYGVDFPMFSKIEVNGPGRNPVYEALIEAQPRRTLPENPRKSAVSARDNPDIRWNFEKFLVSRTGEIVARFDPDVAPEDSVLVSAIEAELSKP